MAPIGLLDVPPELRLTIYKYLFRGSKVIIHNQTTEFQQQSCISRKSYGRAITSILQTCKTVHREASPYLTEELSFEIVNCACSRASGYQIPEKLGFVRELTITTLYNCYLDPFIAMLPRIKSSDGRGTTTIVLENLYGCEYFRSVMKFDSIFEQRLEITHSTILCPQLIRSLVTRFQEYSDLCGLEIWNRAQVNKAENPEHLWLRLFILGKAAEPEDMNKEQKANSRCPHLDEKSMEMYCNSFSFVYDRKGPPRSISSREKVSSAIYKYIRIVMPGPIAPDCIGWN